MSKRAQYTREFKLEAVRLLQAGQKPASELVATWVPMFRLEYPPHATTDTVEPITTPETNGQRDNLIH